MSFAMTLTLTFPGRISTLYIVPLWERKQPKLEVVDIARVLELFCL